MSTRVVAALSAVCALGACTTAAPLASVSAPAVIAVLTDADDQSGTDAVSGAELAVDLLNERHADVRFPPLGDVRLRLVVGDTDGDPQRAESVVDAVVADGAVGVVAADQAEVVAAAGAYASRRELPIVDAATSAGYLLDLGLDWYFRVTPTDRMLADAVFALLRTNPVPGGERAVVLAVGSDTGGVMALLPELADSTGLTLAETLQVDGGGDDEALARLAEIGPDLLIAVAATPAEARRLRRVLAAVQTPLPVVGLGAGFHTDSDGVEVAGMVRPVAWSAEFAARHPSANAVAALYEQRYGQPMSEIAATMFTATVALAVAIDTAGSGDPAAVRVGLRQLSLPATQMIMPWDGLRFADNGQNEAAAAVIEQYDDGWQLVYPDELAAERVVWPTPAPQMEAAL